MKPQHIVATALRLIAIVWALFALNHLNSSLAYANPGLHVTVNPGAVWLVALLQLVACLVLWFFPMTIAGKLLPGGVKPDESAAPAQMAEWQTLGVITVGLWGFVISIPKLVYWITYLGLRKDDYDPGLSAEGHALIASHLVELALSLWLVFGAKGFATMLFRIRTAGVAK